MVGKAQGTRNSQNKGLLPKVREPREGPNVGSAKCSEALISVKAQWLDSPAWTVMIH
jgi:hypothetical protein